MKMTIKTPKGNLNTLAKIERHGNYGRNYLVINSEVICQGKLSYCEKIRDEYISGKRQFPKSFLRRVEQIIQQRFRSNLPECNQIVTKETKSYYAALGYILKPHFLHKDFGFYEAKRFK